MQSPLEKQNGPNPVLTQISGPSNHLTPLDTDAAYARRYEIIKDITAKLMADGIDIQDKQASEFEMILAMSANAFIPEYCCEFLKIDIPPTGVVLEPGCKPYLCNPPDVLKQQAVCRYFREHSELQESLIECHALTAYLGHPLNWLGKPAIELTVFGRLHAGSQYLGTLNGNEGTVFIPGCGMASLNMIREYLKTAPAQETNVNFLLCDNHPFVSEVGLRFCRYLADPRVKFEASSMEDVTIPLNTSHTLLSYVEAAGEGPITKVISFLAANTSSSVLTVAGTSPNEYSGLTSTNLRSIIDRSGCRTVSSYTVPSYSTHLVINNKSVDFADLSPEQAHHLIMTTLRGGPKPNSGTNISYSATPGLEAVPLPAEFRVFN